MSTITTRRKLTPFESGVRKNHTRLRYGVVRLQIDHQEFEIRSGTPGTEQWLRDQIAIALARLIQDSKDVVPL
jgi:hypothetical protein